MQHPPEPMTLTQARGLAGLPSAATSPLITEQPIPNKASEDARQQSPCINSTIFDGTNNNTTTTTTATTVFGATGSTVQVGASLRSRFAAVADGDDIGRKGTRGWDRVLVGRRVNLAEEGIADKAGAEESAGVVTGDDSLLPIRR